MGRDEIDAQARSALNGGLTVVLSGPAGIGKTTACRRILGGTDHRVGQCLSSMSDRPHRPLEHALKCSLVGTPEAVAVEVAIVLGDSTLLIEDLHWADPATLEVLTHLDGVVPLVATTRGPDPFGESACRLDIPPLSRRAARALLRRSRPDLDAEAREQLIDLGGGNPLVLEQLLPGSAETGSPTMAAALSARLAALSNEDRTVLSLLALHGRPLPPELVGGVIQVEGFAACDPEGKLWFRHDVLRVAVLEGLGDDRTDLHRTLAEGCSDAEAAPHLLAIGERSSAAAAAERAAGNASLPERARLLLLAVEASDDACVELRLKAADALLAAHRGLDTLAVLDGIDVDDPQRQAAVGWLQARAAWLRGDAASARSTAEHALALVSGSGAAIEANLRVELAGFDIRERPGDPALQRDIELALEVAERAGTDRSRVHCLAGRARAHAFEGGWRDHYRIAAAIAHDSGDADQECAAGYWELSALGVFGPFADASVCGAQLVERSEELGQIDWYHHALATSSLHAAVAGTLSGCRHEQLQLLLRHHPQFRNRSQVRFALMMHHLDQVDTESAAAELERLRGEQRSGDDRALAWIGSAELACARREPAQMESALAELAESGHGFYGMKVMAESSAIELALYLGAPLPALPRYSELCPPILSTLVVDREGYDLACEGDWQAASARVTTAADDHERHGAARFAGRSAYLAGICASRAGEDVAATRLFERAAQTAEAHGMGTLSAAVSCAQREQRVAQVRQLLTPRELDVLTMVADGATSAGIAATLNISAATVDTHVHSARAKLGAATRRQAARLVVEG